MRGTRPRASRAGYLEIALGAVAVGAGATVVAAARLVGIAAAEILTPVLTIGAMGLVGAAFAMSTSSRRLGRGPVDDAGSEPMIRLPSQKP